jgi:O-antigen/teichoic acid export membrane protein
MINKRQITISAGSSILQILISGIMVFLLYRFLLEIIGPQNLGIWSLVLSISSMTTLANLGMTGSIIKHIADYDALGDKQKISLAIQTAVISMAVLSLIFVVVLLPAADYYFKLTLEQDLYTVAVKILPLSLISFGILMVTTIYQGALYGCHLIANRNGTLVFDSVFHFVICMILASKFGLIGLAYARLFQNCLTLGLTIILIRKHIKNLPIFPCRWHKGLFKEMFGYAVNFQIITLLVVFSDPITKGFLSRYGNISMVAYYEMANKLVQLGRSLLVSANQVLVPTFASLNQLDPKKIIKIFIASYEIIFFLTILVFCLLLTSAPLISKLWVGHYEPIFVVSVVLLSMGWIANTLSVPAYYVGVGTGDMKDNVTCHLLITSTNIILVLFMGGLWDGLGVVAAWSLALMLGGGMLILRFFRKNKIPLNHIIPKTCRGLAFCCLTGGILSYCLWMNSGQIISILSSGAMQSCVSRKYTIEGVMIALFIMIVSQLAWRNPIVKKLLKLFIDIYPAKK